MQRKKLIWINPLSHYVYEGWLKFFNEYFKLNVYDHDYMDVNIGKKFDLKKFLLKETHIFGNFFNFYKSPIKDKDSLKIIGDIFTNSLCYSYFFDKNAIFYTEYFEVSGQKKLKTIIGRFILNIFRKKKFIVLTRQTFDFLKKNSIKVFYLPQIYTGKVTKNVLKAQKENIKILFVGNMKDSKKNIEFIFQVFEKLPTNFSLHLVGAENKDIFKKYKNLFDSGKVKYYGFVKHNKLNEIYNKCDIFFFPSKIDPIGAVVLEAMANGLAIITNKNVGASSYVNGNGFVLDDFNEDEYIKNFLKLANNLDYLYNLKQKSVELVKQNHRFENKKLIRKKYLDFKNFLDE